MPGDQRGYTSKQMGDACEMLVAAELTLAGMPALKVPDCWPDYDVVVQPQSSGDRPPLRVSVKSRTFKRGSTTFVSYDVRDNFDWLAIVLLPGAGESRRRIFVVPKAFADATARKDSPTSKTANERYWRQDRIPLELARFENNFQLDEMPTSILLKA